MKNNDGAGGQKEGRILKDVPSPAKDPMQPPPNYIKMILLFLILSYLALFIFNAYLEWRYYDKAYSGNPCELCVRLNPNTSGCVEPNKNYNLSVVRKTKLWTINLFGEVSYKMKWITLPCDACADIAPKTFDCFFNYFTQKKGTSEIKINLSTPLNFSLTGS